MTWKAERALIVEDEGLIASMIEDMLHDLGHGVAAAVGSVPRALAVLSNTAVDFAILDVNLGSGRSYRIAEELSARGIPFIFATGYGLPGIIPEWSHIPVVQKPFEPETLRRGIEQAMSAQGLSRPSADRELADFN
jgi:CheY-like chemotaxis protein